MRFFKDFYLLKKSGVGKRWVSRGLLTVEIVQNPSWIGQVTLITRHHGVGSSCLWNMWLIYSNWNMFGPFLPVFDNGQTMANGLAHICWRSLNRFLGNPYNITTNPIVWTQTVSNVLNFGLWLILDWFDDNNNNKKVTMCFENEEDNKCMDQGGIKYTQITLNV